MRTAELGKAVPCGPTVPKTCRRSSQNRNSLDSIRVDSVLYGMGIRYGSDFTEDFRSQDLDNCSSGIVFRFLCPGLRFLVQGPGFRGARLAECPRGLGPNPESPGVSASSPSVLEVSEGTVPGVWCRVSGTRGCRSLREVSGQIWSPLGVSGSWRSLLESFYDSGHAAQLSECSRSLGATPSL